MKRGNPRAIADLLEKPRALLDGPGVVISGGVPKSPENVGFRLITGPASIPTAAGQAIEFTWVTARRRWEVVDPVAVLRSIAEDLVFSAEHARSQGRVVVARWSLGGDRFVLSAPALSPVHDDDGRELVASVALMCAAIRASAALAQDVGP